MFKPNDMDNPPLERFEDQVNGDNLEAERLRLAMKIANQSALWPAQGAILPNLDAVTLYAYLKAVFASTYLSGTLFFLVVGLSGQAKGVSFWSLLVWPFFSFFMALLWGTFLGLPIAIVTGVIYLPIYSFLIKRIEMNLSVYLIFGASIFMPAGWILGWDIGLTGFFVFAGALGGCFFYWFDQVEPKRKLSPAQLNN